MSNPPEAYIERPVAVLFDNQVLTLAEFLWRIHPANPAPLAAEVHTAVRMFPTPFRPVGHDGATTERFPGVPVGHMKGDQ